MSHSEIVPSLASRTIRSVERHSHAERLDYWLRRLVTEAQVANETSSEERPTDRRLALDITV